MTAASGKEPMTSIETPHRPFRAVGTALITPFTPDGALDLDAAQHLAAHAVATGNDLLVVVGTTGEAPTLSTREKVDLVRATREAAGPDVDVVAGVGTYDTAHSLELVRAHEGTGIDGLLVVTPYYSKPSQEGIIAHTRAIADATDLPIMLYDIPGRSGVPLHRDTIERLAEHERIVALKDAKGDLLEASLIMRSTGLAYYSGEDALNLPWLATGAAGIVSVVGQVAGQLEAELIRAVDASDLPSARRAHSELAPLVEAIMTRMPGAVAAKAALQLQGVIPSAAVRLPQAPATPAQVRELAAALDAAPGITPVDHSRRPSA